MIHPAHAGAPVGFRPTALRDSLRQLFVLRNVAIAGQALTVLVVHRGLAIPLPIAGLAATIVALAAFNFYTSLRLRQSRTVSEIELLGQILVDVAALTGLLYWSGGANNPFVGLYLLPLTIAAASLPWGYTWLVALLTVACYSLLVFVHVPLDLSRAGDGAMGLLISGMWVNYAISAALIAYFVFRIASALREHDRRLAEARQKEMNSEYVVRLGALAAGAAHELGSPLSTMAVLVNELQRDSSDREELEESLALIAGQIESCQDTLSDLTAYSRDALVDEGDWVPACVFLRDLVEKWRIMRPNVALETNIEREDAGPPLRAESSMGHAILNLLNNAADASPGGIELRCDWDEQYLRIEICDYGAGIPPEMQEKLFRPFYTTKGNRGSGVGLLLAKTAVDRYGGSLTLANRAGNGARAEIVLPITTPRLQAETDRARMRP
jgi:two-component system sensor histidine kinase RegB